MGAPTAGALMRCASAVPGLATGLVLGAALLALLVPGLDDVLVLDRDAVRAGALWRIATGSLVHFSAGHLAWNGLAVGVAGWLLERRGRPVALLLLASAISVGAAVLVFAPQVQQYGGLSGVAYALVVMLAFDVLREGGTWRRLGVLTLIATGAKLAWELGTGQYILVEATAAAFVPVPVSHVAGAAVAVAIWWWRGTDVTLSSAARSHTT
jgi:rhomboid family GlyGly-CTERM serine protease